jgi:hypothetical protein
MPLTVSQIQELVDRSLPAFVFAPDERYFPSNVVSWITNSIAEPWGPESRLSGTAVVRAPAGKPILPADFGSAYVIAGSHFPGGVRLQPEDFSGFQSEVERRLGEGEDVFLDFGGWLRPGGSGGPDFGQGSADRVYPRFSNLANAVNSGNLVEADSLQNVDVSRPNVPQVREAFIYAEVDWAGLYARISDRQQDAAKRDFGPDSPLRRALDQFVVVTYYLFYPMTEYPPDAVTRRAESAMRREGQWEAVSLYYRTRRDPTFQSRRADGLPVVTFDGVRPSEMQLMFLACSRTVHSDDPVPEAEVRSASFGAVEWAEGGSRQPPMMGVVPTPRYHPKVYVTSGTHKNLFTAAMAATGVEQGGPNPGKAVGASTVGTIGGALMAGCAIPVLCVLGVIFLLIAIALAAWSVEDAEETTSFGPTGPENDYVEPGGVTIGGGSGDRSVTARVQTISRLAPVDGEQGDPINTVPPWWEYSGRWGVRVERSASARWDHGTRRVDHLGRSRAYWNTVALLRFLMVNPSEAERVTGS